MGFLRNRCRDFSKLPTLQLERPKDTKNATYQCPSFLNTEIGKNGKKGEREREGGETERERETETETESEVCDTPYTLPYTIICIYSL